MANLKVNEDVYDILYWLFKENPNLETLDVVDDETGKTFRFLRSAIMEHDRSPKVFTDLSGYLTISQYAEHTGKPIATVRNWIRRKKIDTITVDGVVYISENEEPRVRKYTRRETA